MVNEYDLLGTVKDKPMTFHPLHKRFSEMSSNHEPDTISEQRHFNLVRKLASKYMHEKQTLFQDSMQIIGDTIAIDYPFPDRGNGCNTIAGQLDNMSKSNRDCKLLTFLLAVSLANLYPDAKIDLWFDKGLPFHPIVKIELNDQSLLGSFNTEAKSGSVSFYTYRNTVEKFFPYAKQLISMPPTLAGMKQIDNAFAMDTFY